MTSPQSSRADDEYVYPTYEHGPFGSKTTGGMTIRDYFAGQALIAQLSLEQNIDACAADPDNTRRLAVSCYKMADAMLKAKSERGE